MVLNLHVSLHPNHEFFVQIYEHVVQSSPDVADLHVNRVSCPRPEHVAQLAQPNAAVVPGQVSEEGEGLGVALVHDSVEDEGAVDVLIEGALVDVGVVTEVDVEHVFFHFDVLLEEGWQLMLYIARMH